MNIMHSFTIIFDPTLSELLMYLLNGHLCPEGVKPIGSWFKEACRYVVLRYYDHERLPRVLNGKNVTSAQILSDFYRVMVGSIDSCMWKRSDA